MYPLEEVGGRNGSTIRMSARSRRLLCCQWNRKGDIGTRTDQQKQSHRGERHQTRNRPGICDKVP